MILRLWLGCRPPDEAPAPIRWGEPSLAREGAGDQHHATAALGPTGQALVTFRAADWIVTTPLPDGRHPADSDLPFDDLWAHHPQVATGRDGFLLVGSAAPGGLVADALTWDGVPTGEPQRLGPPDARHPDLAVRDGAGLLVWAGLDGIGRWRFEDDLGSGVPLEPIPLGLSGVGTPVVRPLDPGYAVVWAERGDDHSGIRRVDLDDAGDATGPIEDVASWPVFEEDGRPALATGPAGSATAWRRELAQEAWLELRDREGAQLDLVALHADAAAGRPSLDAVGDTVFAVWERLSPGGWTVALQRWDLGTGEAVGRSQEVARTGAPGRPYVAVRARGDTIDGIVTWEAPDDTGRAVWLRPFTVLAP